jgi:hypothetical protein
LTSDISQPEHPSNGDKQPVTGAMIESNFKGAICFSPQGHIGDKGSYQAVKVKAVLVTRSSALTKII